MIREFAFLRRAVLGAVLLLAACGPGGATGGAPAKPAAGGTAASPSPPAARPASGELRIGVNLELSGPASVWGQPQLNALQLLADEINGRGGINGQQIRLIAYDNESNESKSLVVTKRLVEEDQVLAVIGGGTTPTTMPIVPYANEQQVPVVSIGSANTIIEPPQERRWIFKTPSNTRDIVTRMLRFLEGRGWTRVAFMSVNNAYGDAGRAEFEAAIAGRPFQVVAWEKFGATDTDMKPVLTRIRGQNPQVIVVWAIPPAASIVDKNYQELGLTIPLIHDHGASSYVYHELSGGANEGMYVVSVKSMVAAQLPDGDPVKPIAQAYVRDYEAKYNKQAGGVDAMTYDALLLISRALERSGPDRAKLRDALEGLQNVAGTTGVFTLSPSDHNGLSDKDLVIVQIRDGKWVLLE
ncbi:MAG: ABC transporter substrate-binding protein [Chloroflexi bacterium]|nr:ABC transporter substrate-binding protein [Chloroflexota bacterium]